MPTFQDFFDKFAFLAFEKQMRLSSLIGDRDWLLNTEQATVRFNDDQVFAAHFLGTESAATNTWLWADANKKVVFPSRSLELCHTIRETGRRFGLITFVQDHFEFVDRVGEPDAHSLAMVSTCLGNASCYYCCPHEHGAVFIAISDPRIDAQPDLDRQGFHDAFTCLMWQVRNIKTQIVSYCSTKGYIDNSWDDEVLTIELYTGEEVELSFAPTEEGGMKINFEAGLNH